MKKITDKMRVGWIQKTIRGNPAGWRIRESNDWFSAESLGSATFCFQSFRAALDHAIRMSSKPKAKK